MERIEQQKQVFKFCVIKKETRYKINEFGKNTHMPSAKIWNGGCY